MLIAIVPLIATIVGALMFAFSKTNPDLKEMGRIVFAMSLLVLIAVLAGKTVRLL